MNHVSKEAYSDGDLAIHEPRQEEVAGRVQMSILLVKNIPQRVHRLHVIDEVAADRGWRHSNRQSFQDRCLQLFRPAGCFARAPADIILLVKESIKDEQALHTSIRHESLDVLIEADAICDDADPEFLGEEP